MAYREINLLPLEIIQRHQRQRVRGANLGWAIGLLGILLLLVTISFWFHRQSFRELEQAQLTRDDLLSKIQAQKNLEGLYQTLVSKTQIFASQEPLDHSFSRGLNQIFATVEPGLSINEVQAQSREFRLGGESGSFEIIAEYLNTVQQTDPSVIDPESFKLVKLSFDEREGQILFDARFKTLPQ